ncbi:hypothetical protein [Yersinia aldovae]|uniref:hypothetical protein n=1 Tax=Yersinia aldovae TaxID=29483 RepID=UPI0005AD46BB|nr:hypothetical protein [Yersinia aldovae]AJJ62295.1 putative rTX toxin and Ca2+-binding protein [Yersinia aldovae 670-83]
MLIYLKVVGSNEKIIDVTEFIQDVQNNSVTGKISNGDLINIIEKHLGSDRDKIKRNLDVAREDGNTQLYLINNIIENLIIEYNLLRNKESLSSVLNIDSVSFATMLRNAIDSEKIRASDNYSALLLDRGLYSAIDSDEKEKYDEMMSGIERENKKYKELMNDLVSVENDMYIAFDSPNHAMAISIIKDENSTYWTFFDPNSGGKTFSNYKNFKSHVDGNMRLKGVNYGFKINALINLEFNIEYIKLKSDSRPRQDYSVWKKAQDGEQAYIIKSLKENNIIFNLPLSSTAKVIDYSLVQRKTGEWLVTQIVVKVMVAGKSFNVHQSVDSFDNAVKDLQSNIDMIINYINDNPSVKDIYLTNGVVKKSTTTFIPEISKEKKYSEVTVYKPELESLSSRTKKVIDILDRLAEKRVSLVDLSSNSKESLAEFFNLGHDVLNSRDLLRLIADSDFYLQTRLELSELQQVSANNSQLEKLTAREALSICKQNHIGKSDKYLKLVNLADKLGTQKTLRLNQFLTLSTEVNSGQKKQLDLGTAYLYASFKGELIQFKQTLSNHLALCYLKAQGIISDDESEQLDNFNEKFAALSEIQYNDIRHLRTDGNLSSILELDVGYYQLMVDNTLLNITVEKIDEKYSYSIYDTEGGESNFYGIDKSEVSRKALSFIEGYVVSNIKAQSAQDYKLYSWEFSNGEVGGSSFLLNEFYQQSLSTERQRLVELGHTFFNQQKIAFSTLSDMGAVLDGKLLTAAAVANNPDWQTKLRFDPFLINDFYSLPDQTSVEQQQSVKVIKCLLNSKDSNNNLLNDHPDPNVIQDARRYLTAINLSADLNSNTNPKLWDRLIQASAQSSRFQFFGQKVGTATQAIGVLTLSISTYGMAKRLRDPNITDEERKEITKQLAINWSSISVDFGTDLMQSTFDKLHSYFSKKLLSSSPAGVGRIGYKMAAKTAKYAGAGLNLASAGFDIYEAYENFSKANSEGNVDLIIDYKVNGSLAVIGAAVSIITAVALALGLSAAGPIGIAIGAGIMVGGMIYNAVRQVEYIKNKIELTGLETFSTGARLFLGMEPSQEIQERLMAKVLNESITESANYIFKKRSRLMGADNLVFAVEKYDGAREKMYTFVYKIDNEYVKAYRDGDEYEDLIYRNNNRAAESGTDRLDVISEYQRWSKTYYDMDISNDLSDTEISNIISEDLAMGDLDRYNVMRYQRSPLTKYEVDQWKKTVKIDDYDIIEIETTDINKRYTVDNIIVKNVGLLDSHLQLARMRAAVTLDFKSSIIEIKANGNNESILYEKEYNFGKSSTVTTTPENNNGNVHYFLGDGNNFVLAEEGVSNTYETGGGIDMFVGGSKNDQVIITDATGTSVLKYSNLPYSYFDGQGGSDTIYLDKGRFIDQDYRIDLQEGYVNNRNGNVLVAKLANIENVVSQSAGKHVISGNNDDNFLSQRNGNAYLYGREGNDILTLSHGAAYGGEGIDTYIITTDFKSDKTVIIDDGGTDEISNIIVDYNVNEIKSIRLFRNEVHVKMVRDGCEQMLYLHNAYKSFEVGNNKKLNNKYIISTADGFILIPNWPVELSRDKKELPSSLEMIASYNYLTDKKLYKEGAMPIVPKEIIICKEEYNNNYIKIDNEVVYLPDFIKCATVGNSSVRTLIFGNNESETFSNIGGGAFIKMNGGSDVVNIPNILGSSISSNVNINCTSLDNSEKENTLTLIFDDVSGYDLKTKNIVKGSTPLIEVSIKDSDVDTLVINIRHPSFLSSNKGNPLITVIDKNKTVFYIEGKEGGYEIIEAFPAEINITKDNDNIVIPIDYRLENNALDTGEGNDTITDLSGRGHTLNGNQGDDVIWAKSGNNCLNGGHGNDQLFSGGGDDLLYGGLGNDTLCSGNGIDYMSGGEDNDIYIIEKGQGETTINDDHGKNTIIFDGTDYRELWFKKQDNKLLITIEGTEKKVVISNYVSGKGASSGFSFQTNSHKIEGDNLNLLIDYMTRTPEIRRENIQDPVHGMYGMDFHKHWALIAS